MSEEIKNENEVTETEKVQERKNPFCVISKETFGDYSVHDIQTNGAWSKNPYSETYAVVPEYMVTDIMETCGYCDITLNEDGTEVVSFTAREIPEKEPEETPEEDTVSWDTMAAAIEEGVNEV